MRNCSVSRQSGPASVRHYSTRKTPHLQTQAWLAARQVSSLSPLLSSNWKFVLSTQFLTTGWNTGINIDYKSNQWLKDIWISVIKDQWLTDGYPKYESKILKCLLDIRTTRMEIYFLIFSILRSSGVDTRSEMAAKQHLVEIFVRSSNLDIERRMQGGLISILSRL